MLSPHETQWVPYPDAISGWVTGGDILSLFAELLPFVRVAQSYNGRFKRAFSLHGRRLTPPCLSIPILNAASHGYRAIMSHHIAVQRVERWIVDIG